MSVEVKTGARIDITFSKSNTFDLQAAYDKAMQEPADVGVGDKEQMKKLVEDSIRKNFPDITSRETIDWGEVSETGDGNSTIRYKYLAKFHGKDTKVMNQVFTFDPKGKFVSVKDVDGFPRTGRKTKKP